MFPRNSRCGYVAVLFAFVALALIAATPAMAQKKWTGSGDGTSWSDAANWQGGSIPLSTDLVLLDNSLKATTYSVILPGGAVTTSIVRLTIQPGASQTITLTLPAANTGAPGFRVGDATAATDDIILKNGSVLRNQSGAASGNGIEANSTSNGTVRIENGARYVHTTARSTAGVVPLLSTAAGTELGEFLYDSPGTGSIAIGASGRTYGSLTLTRTAGAAIYTSAGAGMLTVRGDFTVNTGVTYTSSMTGAMHLGRDLVTADATALVTLPSTQALFFDGPLGAQTISGAGWVTLNGGGTVASGAAVTIASGAMVALGGTVTNSGSFTTLGMLQINQGGAGAGNNYTWSPPDGALVYNTTSSFAVNPGDVVWPASGGPSTVLVKNAGITLNAARSTDVLEAFAPVANAGNLTVTGTLKMHGGGSFAASPVYGQDATLGFFDIFFDYVVGPEWASGTSVGAGVPRNVTIDVGSSHTVSMPNTDRYLPGVLTLISGTLALNVAANLHLGDGVFMPPIHGTVALTGDRTVILDGNLGFDHEITIDIPESDTLDVEHLRLVDAVVGLATKPAASWLRLSPPNGGESLRMEGDSRIDLAGNTLDFAGSASTLAVADGERSIYNGIIQLTMPLTVASVGGGGTLSDAFEENPPAYCYDPCPVDFGPGVTTIHGRFEMRPGGSILNNHPPIYAPGSWLEYGDGPFTVGPEWSAGSQVGLGVPANVNIEAGDGNTVSMPNTDRYLAGVLKLMSGTLALNVTAGDLHLGDDLVEDTTAGIAPWPGGTTAPSPGERTQSTNPGILVTNGRTVILDGALGPDSFFDITYRLVSAASPTGAFPPPCSCMVFDHLRLVNAHVTLNGDSGWVMQLAPPNGGESLRMVGTSDIHLNGHTLRFGGNASTLAVADGTRPITGPGTIEVTSPLTVVDGGGGGELNYADDNELLTMWLRAPFDPGTPSLVTIQDATLTMGIGGSMLHPPVYTGNATLLYQGGSHLVGYEWDFGAAEGPGVPRNVTVDAGNGSTVSLPNMDRYVPGDFTLTSGTLEMNATSGDLHLQGDVDIAAPLVQNGRVLVLDGSANRTLSILEWCCTNLRMATTGGAMTTLATELPVHNLDLMGGDIATGPYVVTVASGGAVTRTSGSIRGRLQKVFAPAAAPGPGASGNAVPVTFEVGDASGYTPVDITYDNLAAPCSLTVSTTGGEHPDVANSGVDPAKDVNRYWTLSLERAPIPGESYTATFHWLATDQDAGSDYNTYDVYEKAAGWNHIPASFRGSDRTRALGLQAFGDFLVGSPLATGIQPPALIPDVTFAHGAGPNPFRTTTSIGYGLHEAGRVRLAVYDVRGECVRTLLDARQDAGTNSATWDGRDDAGRVLPSGMYVAWMDANGKRFTVPMRLIR